MLPSTSPRRAFLACPPSPPWNLLFFTVESTLSSLAKVQLSLTLTLSHLTIWCFGQTALLLFLLAKAVLAYLPTTLSVALTLLFPYQQTQYAQVFLLKPEPFFVGLGSNSKSATSSLLSDSRSVLATLFSPPSFILLRSQAETVFSLLLFYQATMGPRTRFSRETTRLMSWPDGERYLHLLQSLVVSLLLSLVSSFSFSRTGGLLFHRNSLTSRFSRFPPRNLCSLVFAAMDQPTIKLLSL